MSDCIDHLAIRPSSHAVAQALQWLETIATREEWPPRTAFGLTLCVDEALTNVVSYAFNPPVVEPAIELICRIDADRIVIELCDNGRPHDPTAGEPPPLAACLDEAKAGGHGVRLMRHYLHEMTYRRISDWNHLYLVMLNA